MLSHVGLARTPLKPNPSLGLSQRRYGRFGRGRGATPMGAAKRPDDLSANGSGQDDGSMVPACIHSVRQSETASHGAKIVVEVVPLDGTGVVIPIYIGTLEGSHLSAKFNGDAPHLLNPNRPMTYDLMANIVEATGHTVREVRLVDVKEGIFHARIVLEGTDSGVKILDSRPSDAINIAVRQERPIFIARHVLLESDLQRNGFEAHANKFKHHRQQLLPPAPKLSTLCLPQGRQQAGANTGMDAVLHLRALLAVAAKEGDTSQINNAQTNLAHCLGDERRAELMCEMELAIQEERYEDAAHMRDKLSELGDVRQC